MRYLSICLFILSLTVMGCLHSQSSGRNEISKVRLKAESFFETFAERSDWEKFCSFYSEDVKFRDVMLQLDLDSLWQLKRFYKWDEEGDKFKKLSPTQKHLEIKSLLIDGNEVTALGHLNPFYYNNVLIDTDWGMDFTIYLKFDKHLKIIEQIDWMEYDPFTLESVVKRCRESGHEKIPDWLDLSK